VLVPELLEEGDELTLTVRNVSSALATEVLVYPERAENALHVLSAPSITALRPGEDASFVLAPVPGAVERQTAVPFEEPTEDSRPDDMPAGVPWAGFELLYSDAHGDTVVHTRFRIVKYPNPSTGQLNEHWALWPASIRARHRRKQLLRTIRRQQGRSAMAFHEEMPSTSLWVGAHGVSVGC
jgi:hypothetical protein